MYKVSVWTHQSQHNVASHRNHKCNHEVDTCSCDSQVTDSANLHQVKHKEIWQNGVL